jgi:hypothetical protein
MKNLLFEKIEYKIDETPRGVWRRYLYPDGQLFEEFVSHRWVSGVPMLHYTRGRCPETGKLVVARGVVAIGRLAVGVVAIGQASMGVIAIGQLALGLMFGLGQATTGVFAIGQLAVGLLVGLGQFATGYVTIGQLAFGRYVLAQMGIGEHVWDMRGASPVAKQFFRSFLPLP